MNKSINFFNGLHCGDLFSSKEFVRQIVAELNDFNFGYYHLNHPKLLLDLNIPFLGPSKLEHTVLKFVEEENTLNINTWIGAYNPVCAFEPPYFQVDGIGISLDLLCLQWEFIFEKINNKFGTSLKLKEKFNYLPEIDFNYFNLENHKKFLENRGNTKKILFCNGTPMSFQSIPGDMSDIISYFAEKYSEYDFVCTKKFDSNIKNIFFTDDISVKYDIMINVNIPWNDRTNGICDLNEISYLSNFCDLIIGKQSGPFCFCSTKENFMDKNKHMISFNINSSDSLSHNLDIECDYLLCSEFDRFCNDTQYVIDIIEEKINLI